MFLISKFRKISGFSRLLAVGLFLVVTLTSATLLDTNQTKATGNCPGSEQQGTGTAPLTDKNKCYLNGTATQNTPKGTTSPNNGNGQQQSTGSTSTDKSPCAIEKIGWMLCPIIEGAAKASDWAFEFLADNFLQVEPELLTDKPQGGNGKGTITAWEYARNLANIMFVIAFIIIIYSQITGAGLNNYGIKRMLPRLIVAAIAVNMSYYICQAIVDLSNLLGYNIQKALTEIASSIGPQVMGADPNKAVNFQTTSTGGNLFLIAAGGLALVGIIWVLLPVLGSVIMFILVTCVVIILILLLRKAFIVLLVVLSPIAFVMYLLPNTEKYFNKWLSMFWQLLLVFPIVGLLMGAGQLASTIILVAGTSKDSGQSSKQDCNDTSTSNNASTGTTANGQTNGTTGTGNGTGTSGTVQRVGAYGVVGECTVNIGGLQSGLTLGLVAAGIAVAPLLAVWSVLQGALSAAGAIGGKIGGAVNSVQSRQKGKMSASLKENGEYRKNQMHAAALNGNSRFGRAVNRATLGSARRDAKRRAKSNYAKSALHTAETDYVADASVQFNKDGKAELTRFGRSMAGPGASADQRNRVAANAINAQSTIEAEELKAAHIIVDSLHPDKAADEARDEIAKGNFDSPHLAALLEHLAKTQQSSFMQLSTAVLSGSGGRSNVATRAVASGMSNTGIYSGSDIAGAQRGEAMNLESIAQRQFTNGSVSGAAIAGMTSDGIKNMDRLTSGNNTARKNIKNAVAGLSKEQAAAVSAEKKALIDNIRAY